METLQVFTFIYHCVFQPFNATRINAAAIEDRVKVLQKENKNVSGKAGFYEEFEVSLILIIINCQPQF